MLPDPIPFWPATVISRPTSPQLLKRVALLAVLLSAFGARAQPNYVSPDQYGDRQSGRFGDPGQGYFGNPGAGDFDKNGVKLPPVGAQPMGKVYGAGAATPAPYISLPAPVDAAAPVEAKKKPASPRADSKTKAKNKSQSKGDQ